VEEYNVEKAIKQEITRTEKLISDYKELSQPVEPDNAIGRISRMDAINNQSITEASLRQAEEKLKNLRQVLSMVGRPDFGVCQKCGNKIPVRRILYRPQSLLCVKCAE